MRYHSILLMPVMSVIGEGDGVEHHLGGERHDLMDEPCTVIWVKLLLGKMIHGHEGIIIGGVGTRFTYIDAYPFLMLRCFKQWEEWFANPILDGGIGSFEWSYKISIWFSYDMLILFLASIYYRKFWGQF